MKVRTSCLIALAIFFSLPVFSQQPVYGWRPIFAPTVVALDGFGQTISRGPIHAAHVRVLVSAQYPVSYAFVPKYKGTTPIKCSITAVYSHETRCELEPTPDGYYLMVKDVRPNEGGDAAYAEAPEGPNRVSINIQKWTCLSNCRR